MFEKFLPPHSFLFGLFFFHFASWFYFAILRHSCNFKLTVFIKQGNVVMFDIFVAKLIINFKVDLSAFVFVGAFRLQIWLGINGKLQRLCLDHHLNQHMKR